MSEHKPTDAEIAARNKRNVALALTLFALVLVIFFTMISRGTAAG